MDSEWELVEDEPVRQAQPRMQQPFMNPSEWEVMGSEQNTFPVQPRETFGQSLAAAPSRVYEDVAGGLYNFARHIPQYWESAKQGIPEGIGLALNNPQAANQQAMAGLSELGQNVFNKPHDIANYLSQRLHFIPEDINKKIQMGRMPEDTQQMINQTFGEAVTPGEKAVRGAYRNIGNIIGGVGSAAYLNPMKLTTKNIVKDVLRERESQIIAHNKAYNKLWNEADKAGINNVPVDPNLISNNMSVIKKYKTPREYKSVDNFLNDPTLSNAQKAQSDIGAMRRSLENKSRTQSLTSEERNLYDALGETQQHIESNMFKDQSGNLNQGLMNKYNQISSSYRENVVPYRYNKDIEAFLNKELLPKELIGRLKTGEFAAKKGKEHPRLYATDKMKKALMGLGITGGVVGGGKTLFDFIKGSNEEG